MMLIDRRLLLGVKVCMYLHKPYLHSTMGQTRLSSIVIINIERSYTSSIFQEPMDSIIDILGKRKNCELLFTQHLNLIGALYMF